MIEITEEEMSDFEKFSKCFSKEPESIAKKLIANYRASKMMEEKYTSICDELYGKNLHVVGWHLNGDHEPMDAFFEDCDWLPEPPTSKGESE